jgi:hypothetical protein
MQPFSVILSAEGRCFPRPSFPLGTTLWANQGLVYFSGLEAAVDDIIVAKDILNRLSN